MLLQTHIGGIHMKSPASRHLSIYATLVIVILLWVGNSIIGRAIHDQIGPFSLSFCRWTGALLILLPFAWRGLIRDWRQIRRGWVSVLTLGILGVASYNTLLYFGLRHTTASNALLIQASIPLFVLIFDFAFFRTIPSRQMAVGVLVSALGVAIIVFRADPHALLALRFGIGDAFVLTAAIAWALYTALLRTRPAIQPLSFLAATSMVGASLMLAPAAYEQGAAPIQLTAAVMLGLAYVIVLPSVVAFLLYNRAVAAIGAAAAGQMMSLQPIFGALLAALLLNEPLRSYHGIGMATISLGIAFAISSRKRAAAVEGTDAEIRQSH